MTQQSIINLVLLQNYLVQNIGWEIPFDAGPHKQSKENKEGVGRTGKAGRIGFEYAAGGIRIENNWII